MDQNYEENWRIAINTNQKGLHGAMGTKLTIKRLDVSVEVENWWNWQCYG